MRSPRRGAGPGGVATLIMPADCAWSDAPGPAKPRPIEPRGQVSSAAVDAVAKRLRGERRAVLLLGGDALSRRGQLAAARIAARTKARVLLGTFPPRVERGAGLPPFAKFPYFPEQGVELLAKVGELVLAGEKEPVAFFAYPKTPSRLAPESCHISVLASPDQDATAALEALADALGAKPDDGERAPRAAIEAASGKLTSETARPHARGAPARERGRRRRGRDLRRAVVRLRGRRCAAHGAVAHGRRDRAGSAERARRGARRARPARDRVPGRRQLDVHVPVALDHGAREPRRHRRSVRESRVPDPEGRARARRHPASRPGRPRAHRSRLRRISTSSRSRAASAFPANGSRPPRRSRPRSRAASRPADRSSSRRCCRRERRSSRLKIVAPT